MYNAQDLQMKLLSSSGNAYVKNIEDLKQHFDCHRQRLMVLAQALVIQYPEHFKELKNTNLLQEFLHLHDAAKFSHLEDLFMYYNTRPLFSNVYEAEKFKSLVARVNAQDELVRLNFFKLKALCGENSTEYNKQAKLLIEIERLVDMVDRGLDPVAIEEFAREMRPASEMFAIDSKDYIMAKYLEQEYHNLVGHLSFDSYLSSKVLN